MNRKKALGMVMAVASLLTMAYVDSVLALTYWPKALIKIIVFVTPVMIYSLVSREKLADIISFYRLEKPKTLIIGMFFAFAGMMILFMLVKSQLDLENIKQNLMAKEQLSKDNYLFVFGYIILCNSFLEEVFFRGYIHHLFKGTDKELLGAVFSALCFALYHIAVVFGWFKPWIFILCIAGLSLVGLFLQFICHKHGSLKAGWLVHGCANLAINVIGTYILFVSH